MLKTTQHLNELSPLIKNTESASNHRLRIPKIFGEKTPREHNKFDELIPPEEAEKLQSLQLLVQAFGSSAYQLYQQRSDRQSRHNLLQENNGTFLANASSLRLMKSDISDTCLLRPDHKSYKSILSGRQLANSSLLSQIPPIP